MLENTQVSLREGSILGFKLITGEELIARVKIVDRSDILLEKPHYLVVVNGEPALAAWPMLSKENIDVPINRTSIVSFFAPREDFESLYKQLIVPPTPSEPEKPTIFMPRDKKIIL